jgi:tRNA A-37 threonylcarbamoyl transferase component Bud32
MSESFAAGLVGIVLDERYRLDALLGEGGMGAVYRAHHLQMDRRVAVKLLKPHLTSDDNQVQRFLREARSTMKVESEHAVKVFDFGITPQRDYYMVLEYLDGRTVQRELDVDGPFAPPRVLRIAKQALHALAAAHAAGLVHRDIKPDNILLMRVGDDGDYTKMLDFGVAKLMDGASGSDRSMLALTQTGMVFGTPEYMSPEQACGQKLDGRSDLYSLACTMFAMLTGCGMFNASSPIEWLTMHARTPPPHLTDGAKELAPYTALDAVLQKCLAKRREDRPQTAAEMSALLDEVLPTLGKARSASSSARGLAMRAAQSNFVAAIDPNATLLPGASVPVGATAATRDSPYAKTMLPGSLQRPMVADAYAATISPTGELRAPATTTGVIAEVQRGRRGLWLVLGAAAIAAMMIAVVIAASRGHRAKPPVVAKLTERDAKPSESDPVPEDAAAPTPVPIDAAEIEASRPDAGVARPDARVRHTGPNPDVARMIGEAESAQKAGNRLKQIAMADAALQLDPRNSRAKFLLADGLLATGDRERGCKYLRDLRNNPSARSRASQAGCALESAP